MLPMLCGGAVLAAACSLVPPQQWPAHDERTVVLDYEVHDNSVEVPVSGPGLTILELRVEPAPRGEHYAGGRRFLEAPDGCTCFTVHCHYRAYAQDGRGPPAPETVFPGAIVRAQEP